jgi:hypothetical protein
MNNFAPRLGVAYRLTPKTVVRAGAGIFYGEADYLTSESARWINQTPDFTEVITPTNNIVPAAIVRDGFAPVVLPAKEPVPGTNIEVSRDEYPNQYASQWFLDIQRELPGDMLFVIGYQGAKSTHLYEGRNINNGGPHPTIPANQRRVRPTWNNITLRDPGYNSSYQAMVVKTEKRFAKGLTFITSYTWAHNIDQNNESLDQNLAGVANIYNYRAERGNSGLDRRHSFVGSFTYELPFGRTIGNDWPSAAKIAFGGWQLGGLVSLRTGIPFSVSYPGDPQNSGTANRGDRIGVGTLPDPTIDKRFDEFAFVASAPGVYGNTGRNVLYGPGSKNLDFILGKRFQMPWEGHALQFRFESFNVTNTPTFGQPNATLRGQATASINEADEPRRIQFALKYVF